MDFTLQKTVRWLHFESRSCTNTRIHTYVVLGNFRSKFLFSIWTFWLTRRVAAGVLFLKVPKSTMYLHDDVWRRLFKLEKTGKRQKKNTWKTPPKCKCGKKSAKSGSATWLLEILRIEIDFDSCNDLAPRQSTQKTIHV